MGRTSWRHLSALDRSHRAAVSLMLLVRKIQGPAQRLVAQLSVIDAGFPGLLLRAAPFQVRSKFRLSRHAHLELSAHYRAVERIAKTKLRTRARWVRQKDYRGCGRRRDTVVNDVPLVVKIDRLVRLACCVLINIEQITVCAIE